MDISKRRLAALLYASAMTASDAFAAGAVHEAASVSACQTASVQPPIANAKAALARNPTDLRTRFALADAWSDAGCFNDALAVLQSTDATEQGNKEYQTRLRVAKSLVGEERFFDDLDRANSEAKLKRDTFRCTTLADLEACNEAVGLRPNDPALLIADGDALSRAQRPADALGRYRRAATLLPDKTEIDAKINATEAELASSQPNPSIALNSEAPRRRRQAAARPHTARGALQIARTNPSDTARHYSNAEPEASSH